MIGVIFLIFVLVIIAFLIIYYTVKPSTAETAIPKGYRLCVIKEGFKFGMPYYVPEDQKSDVRIPWDQFVAHFPEEQEKLTGLKK